MAKKKTFKQHVAEMEKSAEAVIAERGYNPNPQFMPTYLDCCFMRNDEGLGLVQHPIAVKTEAKCRAEVETKENFVRWLNKEEYDKCNEQLAAYFKQVMEERIEAAERMEEISHEGK